MRPASRWGNHVEARWNVSVHGGAAFSTKAESNVYRSWGMDIIGMTNLQEAKLAREAEMCYVTVAMVTDYDCWHHEHTDVDVAEIIRVLHANVDKAHGLVAALARQFPRQHPPCPVGSDRALDVAIITPPEARDIPTCSPSSMPWPAACSAAARTEREEAVSLAIQGQAFQLRRPRANVCDRVRSWPGSGSRTCSCS